MRLPKIILSELDASARATLTRRSAVPDRNVRAQAQAICEEVAAGGDEALDAAAARFGGGRPGPRRVSADEMANALAACPPELVTAFEASIDNVAGYHRAQTPVDLEVETTPGVTISRQWSPLRRVGAYVPGGKAAYPSTLIMTVVPAKVAGVAEIVVASPAGPDGTVPAPLLAAAALAGVDEFHVMGGAQAVAALAYGTETVEPVEKIVGPGNAWVTAAKLAVFGDCAIDLPAGPSEVLVLADGSSDARLVAIDMLCQAEHGPDSPAVLVTTDPAVAEQVQAELTALLPQLERRAILETSLTEHGLIVIADDHGSAIDFANDYAAEHVSVATGDPEADAKQITSAGSVYVGRWAPESAGDYATGANHVLPTGGLPRAYGPLSTDDFGSWRQVQTLTKEGLTTLLPTITALATAEGLTAHRMAAELRFETGRPS